MADARALAADLLMRIGVDASGIDAEIASKLTGAERTAVAHGDKISAGIGRGLDKVTASQLRVVAATEKYNRVLQDETATVGQKASAQAALIGAQQRLSTEQSKFARAQDETTAGAKRLSLALTGVTAAAGAYVIASAGKYKEVAGEVRTLARLTGDTAESASKLRFAAKESGVGMDSLSTGVRQLEKHLVANDAAAKSLGFAYRDATGDLLPFDQILARVADRFQSLPDGPEKTALALQLFGKQGATLIPLLNRGSQGMDELSKRAEKLGLVLGGSHLDAVKRAAQAQKDLSSATEALQVAMGEKALPVVTKFKELLAGGLNFAAEHRGLSTTATAVVGLGAAFGKTAEYAGNFNEITASASSLLAFRNKRSVETIAVNTATARSYDGLAASASRATAAERAAAVAGGGGAVRGLATRAGFSRAGFALAAFNPITAVVATVGATAFVVNNREKHLERDLVAKTAASPAALDSAKRRLADLHAMAAAANTSGFAAVEATRLRVAIDEAEKKVKKLAGAQREAASAAKEHADSLKNERLEMLRTAVTADAFAPIAKDENITAARKSLDEAVKARDAASRAVAEARGGSGGGASASSIRAAELRLQAARQTFAKNGGPSAEASVISAQERLNALRAKGKATADQTAGSERKIADAIDSQREAQKRVNEAREKLDEASGLSQKQVLGRLLGNVKDKQQYGKDVAALAGAGVSVPVLSTLRDLDRQVPGTIRRIVKDGIKPTFVKELNSGFAKLEGVADTLDKSLTLAGTRAGKTAAEATYRAYLAELNRRIAAGLGDVFNEAGRRGAGPRADRNPSNFQPQPAHNPSRDRLFNAGFPAP